MRCKQCNRKMKVAKGSYAVCLGCGRIVSFRTSTVQPGDPRLIEVQA
jgi:hypothetical protein